MLIPILIFDVALVAWSLHLMQSAWERREFSLVLAATLVGASAVALLVVYFIINSCLGRLS
jgi:uncharacterized membrane protein YcjF (UPF0283 family)